MKKVLVLLLALIMVLSAFVTCGPKDPAQQGGESSTPAGNDPQQPGASDPKPSESESESTIGNLDPSLNLNGKEVTVISRSHYWFADEVSVEDPSGDPIESAMFQRNLDVERILNCTLENFKVTET